MKDPEALEKGTEVNSSPSLTAHETRRQTLVLVAFHLMAEKGVEGLRIRDVAANAGMNIGTLYYYFPTKEGLIQSVVDYLVQHIVTIQAPVVQMFVKTPADALHQHFANLVYELSQTPDVFRVMDELLLRSQRDAAIYPILKQTDENWQSYLMTILEAGHTQGLFPVNLDPSLTALTIMSFFKGMPVQLGMFPGELEKMVDQLERWLFRETSTD